MAGQFLTLSRTVGMEERQALIESVTEDQVMLLANERFDSDRLAVALVGDVHGLELVSNSLSC
jgi:predicted Zn-dependent peptidase